MMQKYLLIIAAAFLIFMPKGEKNNVGQTKITKWQYGKKAAVSMTYDDGTINQFRVAMPLMDAQGFPGTFYVPTGKIPGSKYKPRFIGRPVKEIIKETAEISTNEENFFERASAVRFLGYEGTYPYHTQAGQMYEGGRIEGAYALMDEVYEKVRSGGFPSKPAGEMYPEDYNVLDEGAPQISWKELQKFSEQGHEIGSHTITHPRLAVLDEKNMLYELEKSKQDILDHLGEEHIFSAECPYGTEDERVMEYALEVYPALRNRMPEPFLEELNRSNDADPRDFDREYVQWQRGALSDTPMDLMKSWIDTSLKEDNIWLVLVFHGIEGIGWEPLSEKSLKEYFTYIKEKEENMWVATFKDVTKYTRERMNAAIKVGKIGDKLTVQLSHTLDKKLYNLPLTLKTYVQPNWKTVKTTQGDRIQQIQSRRDDKGTFVLYQVIPNEKLITLSHL